MPLLTRQRGSTDIGSKLYVTFVRRKDCMKLNNLSSSLKCGYYCRVLYRKTVKSNAPESAMLAHSLPCVTFSQKDYCSNKFVRISFENMLLPLKGQSFHEVCVEVSSGLLAYPTAVHSATLSSDRTTPMIRSHFRNYSGYINEGIRWGTLYEKKTREENLVT